MVTSFFRVELLSLILIGIAVGCSSSSSGPGSSALTDQSFLTADFWNDGQAEVAFYRVERTRDQYGNENRQQFLAGTYLVKHRFSPIDMTKKTDGSGVPSFKYALFYELESGSYQYKRNWVVNARQNDLRPFKQSFTSFDWCSNLYREIAVPQQGPVQVRMRSDDYGNRRTSIPRRNRAFPPAQIPLLVRGFDFAESDTLSFTVMRADSTDHVSARAVWKGRDSVETETGTRAAERISVTYDAPVPSLIGEESAETETYWIGTGPQQHLLRLEAEGGRYRMALVEHLRSAYWKENVWSLLSRVDQRP